MSLSTPPSESLWRYATAIRVLSVPVWATLLWAVLMWFTRRRAIASPGECYGLLLTGVLLWAAAAALEAIARMENDANARSRVRDERG